MIKFLHAWTSLQTSSPQKDLTCPANLTSHQTQLLPGCSPSHYPAWFYSCTFITWHITYVFVHVCLPGGQGWCPCGSSLHPSCLVQHLICRGVQCIVIEWVKGLPPSPLFLMKQQSFVLTHPNIESPLSSLPRARTEYKFPLFIVKYKVEWVSGSVRYLQGLISLWLPGRNCIDLWEGNHRVSEVQ